MYIWGGNYHSVYFNNGGRYSPVSNSWSPMPMDWRPSERSGHSCAWTGIVMLVWSGEPLYDWTGGVFYPNTPPIASRHLRLRMEEMPSSDWDLIRLKHLCCPGPPPPRGAILHDNAERRCLDALFYEWDLNGDAHFDNKLLPGLFRCRFHGLPCRAADGTPTFRPWGSPSRDPHALAQGHRQGGLEELRLLHPHRAGRDAPDGSGHHA